MVNPTQRNNLHCLVVADEDPEGFFVITPNGMTDTLSGKGSRTFNCSKSVGPQGDICDTNRTKYETTLFLINNLLLLVKFIR